MCRLLKHLTATRICSSTVRAMEDLFVPVLRNCSNIVEFKKVHALIVVLSLSQSNFLVTKMVDVYDRCAEMEYADLLFKQVVEPNGYLYNALIRAYTHNHIYGLAITLYKQMLSHSVGGDPILPDKFTFPFVVKSCSGLLSHVLGKQIHAHICKAGPKSHSVTENALIDMYTKCNNLVGAHRVFEEMTERNVISWNCLLSGHVRIGQMREARALFDEMPQKTIVSWTAMISGYIQIGCHADALDVFWEMQQLGVEPDDITVLSVLPACAQLGALEVGKWIHIYSDKNGFLQITSICNALIEMYAKCGCINQGWQLFKQMSNRDVISWSTMIVGLANHGRAHDAIELFQDMQRSKVKPNAITFLGLLSACSHAGLWWEGLKHFDSMKEQYHIEPEIEHYGCLVDLLGRSGCLDQALNIIKKMPMKPDAKLWGCLLSSCRTHRNLENAIIAMDHLEEFEPDDSGNYVLLANIYADLGKWDGVSKIRKLMRSKSMKKTPGCSLIEVNNLVQEFVSGDISKPFTKHIFWTLELLTLHQDRFDDLPITMEDG